jgi:lipoprotein-anchoring transpeptidase ErfK/SrfK
VYYRTTHPVGTIVVSKSQRFLYLTRPNAAALRYTIAIGRECENVSGLLLVSAKENWVELATDEMALGRFGVRSLALADTGHRIHGADARRKGQVAGCIPLLNEDVVDLYNRVGVGTRVIFN